VLSFNHSYVIAFRYWNGVELVDHPGWPKNFFPYLPSPPVVGDVDGDGQEEILIATYHPANNPSDGGLSIFGMDGTLKLFLPVPGGVKHVPALADVNGDGSLDVVFRSLLGRVYAYNFGATGSTRVSWATHRGNKQRDGNRSGSLFPPGTPLITRKVSGFQSASFNWTNFSPAGAYRIYRAEQPNGPFAHVSTVTPNTTRYTDDSLRPGWQYFYEVEAIYATIAVRSSPFAVLSGINSNLIANAGFEENENSHWDKWYTGNIEMTNMLGNTNVFHQGRQSMRIRLRNQGNNSSIAQFNQYGIPDASIAVTPGTFYSFGCFFKSGGLNQPSEHWLEWSSTKTASNTNDRPALPWPNYFTPHFVIGTNATGWVYANRVLQMPAGFPNLELRHRYTIAAPGSGSIYIDDVFLRPLPAPGTTNWMSLIPFGADWRYLTDAPPAGWAAEGFNDASWPRGIAKFGAGDGPANVITRLPQRKAEYYFRRKFVVPSTQLQELLLAATCTDDYGGVTYPLKIYLNGIELKTSGIDPVTGQGNLVRYFDLSPFLEMLQPGTNTLAVVVRNTSQPTWDDVAFDVSLRAIAHAPARRLTLASVQPAGIQLAADTPPGTIWQLQSCDDLGGAAWQLMEQFTNNLPVPRWFLDTGQNGRLIPSQTKARFYRLAPY
jgi:hypothetical protein